MKKTRFFSMLLASQLVLCGTFNILPTASAKNFIDETSDIVCEEAAGFVSNMFLKVAKYVLSAAVVIVATEEGLALCREKFCDCAFSYQALRSAGLDIAGAQEYYSSQISRNENETEPNMREWCLAQKEFTQVTMRETAIPGLYCYQGTYYFLTGCQGIQLGRVLYDAISFANTFWETLKETTKKGVTYAFQKAKEFLNLQTRQYVHQTTQTPFDSNQVNNLGHSVNYDEGWEEFQYNEDIYYTNNDEYNGN